MSGLRKAAIAERIQSALTRSGCSVSKAKFIGDLGDLPWQCKVTFPDESSRDYRLYFWTISHGGRTRSQSEYRIQAKLKTARSLSFATGTTLLIGYYVGQEDRAGRREGNKPSEAMEIFAAWDPLQHLRVGASSSCQVRFDLLQDAYTHGVATGLRNTSDGAQEQVVAMRPEYLWSYFRAAAGGHNSLDISRLTNASI